MAIVSKKKVRMKYQFGGVKLLNSCLITIIGINMDVTAEKRSMGRLLGISGQLEGAPMLARMVRTHSRTINGRFMANSSSSNSSSTSGSNSNNLRRGAEPSREVKRAKRA